MILVPSLVTAPGQVVREFLIAGAKGHRYPLRDVRAIRSVRVSQNPE